MKFSTAFRAGVVSSIFLLSVPIANAATETVVYSFCGQLVEKTCAGGSLPFSAALIDVNGKLYGATNTGGEFGKGTLFKFNPKTGRETALHSFGGGADGVDVSGLLNINGTLYGATNSGGAYGAGTVFSFVLETKTETVLHSFGSSGDGGAPELSVPTEVNGVLYGTTYVGGAYGYGTIYSLDPKSGTETILHSFQNNGSDGLWPWTGLIYVHDMLYGTTLWGGSGTQCGGNGCGAVYSVNLQNGVETVRHSFTCENGDTCQPFASLVNYKGLLYGTTWWNPGVFSYNPRTKIVTALQGSGDASGSLGALININGTLYGTNHSGGVNSCGQGTGCGSVFSVDPQSGSVNVVYSFQDNGSDGYSPLGGLVDVKSALYGTTGSGGTYNGGTIFKITP